jgi:hypothetical protein
MRCAAGLLLAGALHLGAAELELRFTAIERILGEQLFSQDGRLYVRGDKANRCKFAYLENPHIGADNGRLRVSARFGGRQAINMGLGCLGPGDSFDLALTAVPFVKNGAVHFKDVEITTTKNSYYIRRVRSTLAASLGKDFKIEVQDQAKKQFEEIRAQSKYPVEFEGFSLSDIRVTGSALILVVDFRLVVK